MLQRFNATYDNGKLILTDFPKRIKRAKVLITVLEEEPELDWQPLKYEDLLPFNNSIKLTIDPLEFQKRIRDEW